MRKEKPEGWYSKKSFAHFDVPLKFDQAKSLVERFRDSPSHSFLPFIGFSDVKRRFKPKSKKSGKNLFENKSRELRYCAHRDGYIHAYYAKQLNVAYEKFLSGASWGNCVIGYRARRGTNIHMAKNAFEEIKRREECVAIAFDISDFFGSIDHNILLENLKSVLDVDRLPEDWFKIYRTMTRYSWVEYDDIVKKLKFDKTTPPKPLCDLAEFRQIREDDPAFINVNRENHGIPQGSPISAVFSNVYMSEFDPACFEFVDKIGGYYRRYSDDIFIVCNIEDEQKVRDFISEKIVSLGESILISDEKTEVSRFKAVSEGALECDRPVTYLGFTFDGQRTSLRARTLSRYYRRMTYATRHTANTAKKNVAKKVFRRKLYRQFTHLGKNNFYSYTKRASSILEEELPKRQLRKHFKIINRKLRHRGK